MISHWKYIPAMVIATCMLESCIMTTVVDDVNQVVENYAVKSKSNESNVGELALKIYNKASNTSLQIDSLEHGNKIIKKSSTLKFEDSVCYSIKNLRLHTKNSYIKIYGRINCILENSRSYLIYSGTMYFPLTGKMIDTSTSQIKFELSDNCPLYYQTNGKMEKVLKSINFDVSVDKWNQ